MAHCIASSRPPLLEVGIFASARAVPQLEDIFVHESCNPTPPPPGPPTPPPPALPLGRLHRINPCGRSSRVGTIVAPVDESGL